MTRYEMTRYEDSDQPEIDNNAAESALSRSCASTYCSRPAWGRNSRLDVQLQFPDVAASNSAARARALSRISQLENIVAMLLLCA
jgi:hypothetical protein